MLKLRAEKYINYINLKLCNNNFIFISKNIFGQTNNMAYYKNWIIVMKAYSNFSSWVGTNKAV